MFTVKIYFGHDWALNNKLTSQSIHCKTTNQLSSFEETVFIEGSLK